MPASNDTKGPDYCGTPLNRNPFPLPNHVVPRHAVPPRFVSPPGPFEASPLCPPPALEGLRYRSPPNHSPGVPLSPFGSRGDPFYNSPFGMCDPSASFGTPSSASSFSNAGNFRHGGHRSWNGTPNNGKEFRRGMKRSTPNVHQVLVADVYS